MRSHNPLPYEMLTEFSYEPTTGILRRKHAKGGKPIRASNHGYLVVRYRKKLYQAHRVAYYVMTGNDPGGMQLDHINGDRCDNRWVNLRLVNQSQNSLNMTRRTPRSLPRCVYTSGSRFVARCHGQYLGLYDTPEEAHEAYLAAMKARGLDQFLPECVPTGA